MTHLKEGMEAPAFSGRNQRGEEVSLAQFRGKKVVLYFYPKDNTSGCTAQACNLNDNYQSFIAKGYEVIGVSPDSEKSHKNFAEKYGLQFHLLADTERSEEHTSELQSRPHLVCRLLLEKKKAGIAGARSTGP